MTDLSCSFTPLEEFSRHLGLIRSVKTIAVVGMSPNADRSSHEVGLYLKDKGYTVLPIHPTAKEIAGMKVFSSVTLAAETVKEIELLDLFVSGDRTMAILREAHKLGIRRVWFQPGSENAETEAWARDQGFEVVRGTCTMAVLMRGGE